MKSHVIERKANGRWARRSLVRFVCVRCRALAINVPSGWFLLSWDRERQWRWCICKQCANETEGQ